MLFLGVCSLGFSQSFEDAKVYQVQGKLLNRLESDLLKEKSELTESQLELKKQLPELQALRTQLTTVSELLKKSENQTVVEVIAAVFCGFCVGGVVVWLVK